MRLPALALATASLAAALLAPVSASAETVRPGGAERLSDEVDVTRWAHAAQTSPVRAAPSRSARTITRLHFFTEDRHPEVYVALERRHVDGVTWIRVRVPMRPNGRTGWVPAAALGPMHVVRTRLVVNRRTLRATLYRSGRAIWRAPVGVGAPGTPTPAGYFHIRERLRGGGGPYGPWAFGTSAYSSLSDWPGGGVVGIHGTNAPSVLPGRVSHGCIRVRNGDIVRLARLMPIGTPVRIL
jgi:lipoprotein-anchoring transpeptidase ErfK/SrfK